MTKETDEALEGALHRMLESRGEDGSVEAADVLIVQKSLGRSGFAIVPVEPTEAAEQDGAEAYHQSIAEYAQRYADRHPKGRLTPPYHHCPADWIKPVYQAMLRAAQGQEPGNG